MRNPIHRCRQHFLLFLSIVVYGRPVNSCIGGGSGGGSACCPVASTACAPSVPVCSGSSGYSSYSAGGSYAAPQISYPRPYGYSAPCSSGGCGSAPAPCSSSAGGCGAGPQISIIAPPPISQPSYASAPVGGYAQSVEPIAPSYSAPLPPLPVPPPPAPSYNSNAPQPIPVPGPEIDNNYEDNNQQNVAPPAPNPNYGDQPPQPPPVPQNYNEQNPIPPPPDYTASEGKQNYDNTAVSEAPQAKSIYENQHDYADETNTLGGSEPASVAPASVSPTDESAATLNCEDAELRKIVEASLQQAGDNLDAARKIESEAAARFGGRFNSIVSNSEFAYVNWYGKRNCQLRVNDRHSLTWED